MQFYKLKKRREYLALGAHCTRHVLPAFLVLSQKNEEKCIRIGFTASKKVGNAVARNLAKRRMKAVFDKVLKLNPSFSLLGEEGLSMNWIARSYILNRDFNKMVLELTNLLEKELNCKV